MFIETSSHNHGHERVLVSWEKTDIIPKTNETFYHNRFSILTNDSLKSMGRFRLQLLSEDNTLLGVVDILALKLFNRVIHQHIGH